MGKANRERRTAKRRSTAARARRGAGRPAEPGSPPPSSAWREAPTAAPPPPPPPSLDDLVAAAAQVGRRGPASGRDVVVAQLIARIADDGSAAVSRALAAALCRAVTQAWRDGWQPAVLVHACARQLGAAHRRMCADAVALDARRYVDAAGADPDWLAQVAAVGPAPQGLSEETMLGRWAARHGLHDGVGIAIEVLAALQLFPRLPRLCPPPMAWRAGAPRRSAGRGDPKMTQRVRALLAKAESTTFPEEAEALTAKAQELIARHAIDRAMLDDDGSTVSEVIGRRILLDDPYIGAKSLLVAVIAEVNRCRAVSSEKLGFSTVFGHPADLDDVELLHASLLTQATAAMAAAGAVPGAAARHRSRRFRQSFLVSFAYRIGDRLEGAAHQAASDAHRDHGDRLLPVLAAREEAVEAKVHEVFPALRSRRFGAHDAEGWVAGRLAADQAHIGPDGRLQAG